MSRTDALKERIEQILKFRRFFSASRRSRIDLKF